MARAGPPKVRAYSREFKLTADLERTPPRVLVEEDPDVLDSYPRQGRATHIAVLQPPRR